MISCERGLDPSAVYWHRETFTHLHYPPSCNSLGPQCAWTVLLVTDVKTTFKIPNARLSKAAMAVICKSVAWQKRPALCQYLFSKTVWVLVPGDSVMNNWHFMLLLRVEVAFYTAVMFVLFYLLCKVNWGQIGALSSLLVPCYETACGRSHQLNIEQHASLL